MPSPDWLRRLPSVNEILDKPPLRAVVEKWNRSAVAARVRSFLEEIRDEVQARTGEISVSELAERAARYVLGPSPRTPGTAINATGQLWGKPWRELPLAEEPLHAAVQAARDFGIDTTLAGEYNDAERIACQLTGAEAALVLNSRLGALEVALRALATQGRLIVGRGEVAQLTSQCRLTDLTTAVGAQLCEVGTINATSQRDFAAALAESASIVLRIEPEDFVVFGQAERPTIAELASVARENATPLVVDLGRCPLIEGLPTDGRDVVTASQAVADGTALVIVRTDGFVGGPPCALLLGEAALIDRVRRHPFAAAHRANGLTTGVLAVTLELFRDPDRARFQVPLLSLLDTPLENLRTRAERLAPQLAERMTSAEAVSVAATAPAAPRACRLPSWGIALTPVDGDIAALQQRLLDAAYPVVGRVDGERLLLDLRTVFPRQDLDLVDAVLTGARSASNESASS
jgi:L-seryl-tRNA(Ser) seleniumtransferase